MYVNRSAADVNLVVKILKRDFPTRNIWWLLLIWRVLVPLKSVEIPAAHTEDAAILRLMQKQIIDTLNAIVEITLICNHVEIRSLLGLPLYKYRYLPLIFRPLNTYLYLVIDMV